MIKGMDVQGRRRWVNQDAGRGQSESKEKKERKDHIKEIGFLCSYNLLQVAKLIPCDIKSQVSCFP